MIKNCVTSFMDGPFELFLTLCPLKRKLGPSFICVVLFFCRYVGVCAFIKVCSMLIFILDWWLIRNRQRSEKKEKAAMTVGEAVNSIISLDKCKSRRNKRLISFGDTNFVVKDDYFQVTSDHFIVIVVSFFEAVVKSFGNLKPNYYNQVKLL